MAANSTTEGETIVHAILEGFLRILMGDKETP